PGWWFAATVGGLWRSHDRGASWECVSGAMRSGTWGAVACVPGSAEVFAGGGDPQRGDAAIGGGPGLWRSTDHGAPGSWRREGPATLGDGIVTRIVVEGRDPRDVLVASDRGVFVARRDGKAWRWSKLGGFG